MSFCAPHQYRVRSGPSSSTDSDGNNGAFRLPHVPPSSLTLFVMASDGAHWEEDGLIGTPWEHVSVSTNVRCPSWVEMCYVKSLFWGEDDVVLQFHPRKSEYVNTHPFCLHLWRPVGIEIPTPPAITVGVLQE